MYVQRQRQRETERVQQQHERERERESTQGTDLYLLSPMSLIADAGGPINVKPSSSQS